MDSAIGVVDQLLRMPLDESAAAAGVSRVGGGGGVAAAERLSHGSVADGPGPSAVPHGLKFSVPAGGGQPDFDLDIGVVGGSQGRGDAAKCGQILERGRSRSAAGHDKFSSAYGNRERDLCGRERQRGQGVAGRGEGERRRERQGREREKRVRYFHGLSFITIGYHNHG